MKKTAAALALTLVASSAFAEIATLGCAYLPQSNSHPHGYNRFSLTFNTESGKATLHGILGITPRVYPTYDLKADTPGNSTAQAMTLTVKGAADTQVDQGRTGMMIHKDFDLPAGKNMVEIKIANTDQRILCPVPTRSHGLD